MSKGVIVYDVTSLAQYVLGDCIEVSVDFGKHKFGNGIGKFQFSYAFVIVNPFTNFYDGV